MIHKFILLYNLTKHKAGTMALIIKVANYKKNRQLKIQNSCSIKLLLFFIYLSSRTFIINYIFFEFKRI